METVVRYVKKLTEEGITEDELAIICRYNQQVTKIKTALKQIELGSIAIGSVERFQGQERNVVIVTTTRGSDDYLLPDGDYEYGFIKSAKQFNVAITRAKALLIIIGNPLVLKQARI